MPKALIILHAPPDAPDCRALTALRLAGAVLADSKEVHLFLVEEGTRTLRAMTPEEYNIWYRTRREVSGSARLNTVCCAKCLHHPPAHPCWT